MYHTIFYKSNNKRAKNLILALTLFSTSVLFELFASLWTYYRIMEIDELVIINNDHIVQLVSISENLEVLSTILLILCGILLLLWFRRAYFNMKERIVFTYYENYWAVIAWFIPFLNFYRPFKMMKEMTEEGLKYIEENRLNTQEKLTIKDIYIWWGFWIFSNIFVVYKNHLFNKIETLDDFKNYTLIYISISLIFIITSLFFVNLVQKYNEMELTIQNQIDIYNENLLLNNNENVTENN